MPLTFVRQWATSCWREIFPAVQATHDSAGDVAQGALDNEIHPLLTALLDYVELLAPD